MYWISPKLLLNMLLLNRIILILAVPMLVAILKLYKRMMVTATFANATYVMEKR